MNNPSGYRAFPAWVRKGAFGQPVSTTQNLISGELAQCNTSTPTVGWKDQCTPEVPNATYYQWYRQPPGGIRTGLCDAVENAPFYTTL